MISLIDESDIFKWYMVLRAALPKGRSPTIPFLAGKIEKFIALESTECKIFEKSGKPKNWVDQERLLSGL
jgi:hypothetical protein